MKIRIRIALAAAAVLLPPATALGGGFQVNEQGAAATAMAGAFTAKADDPSTIYFNPAGMASLNGPQGYLGMLLIFGASTASATPNLMIPDSKTDMAVVPIPNIYVSYGLPGNLAIGAGVFSNFGLKVDWPTKDWSGRFVVTNVELINVTVNPTIAWRPVSWFAIGGGFDITPGRVQLERRADLVVAEAQLRFRGNDVGIGGNAGILFYGPKLHDRKLPFFTIGATYRSRYNFEFNDGAVQTFNVPPALSPIIHDVKASANVPIPDIATVGVGIRPLDSLFIQAQFDWTHWRRFQSLTLQSPSPQFNINVPEEWSDGYTLRSGAEFVAGRVKLRLGFGYDWTPVPATTLNAIVPDASRFLVSGGIGVDLPGNFVVDGSVMGVIFRGRDSLLPEFPAHFQTWAVLMGLAVSYQHPKYHPQAAAAAAAPTCPCPE
jgi:long-chain fatty acid transport protein